MFFSKVRSRLGWNSNRKALQFKPSLWIHKRVYIVRQSVHEMYRMHYRKKHKIPYYSLVSSYICMQPQIVANPAQQFSHATCNLI